MWQFFHLTNSYISNHNCWLYEIENYEVGMTTSSIIFISHILKITSYIANSSTGVIIRRLTYIATCPKSKLTVCMNVETLVASASPGITRHTTSNPCFVWCRMLSLWSCCGPTCITSFASLHRYLYICFQFDVLPFEWAIFIFQQALLAAKLFKHSAT